MKASDLLRGDILPGSLKVTVYTVIFRELAMMSPMRRHHYEFSENNSIIIVAFLASRANAL